MATMPDTAIFDLFLRGSAFGALALCALVFLTNGARTRKSVSVALLCLGLGPYLVLSSPNIELAPAAQSALIMVASTIPVLVYWAAIELFQDSVGIRPWQIVIAAILVVSAWLAHLNLPTGAIRGACALVLFAHILGIVIKGDADDLVATRRRFRRWFLAWVLCLGIIITALEITQLDRALPHWVYMSQATLIFLSAGAFLLWSVRLRSDIWIVQPAGQPEDVTLSPAQAALIGRIEKTMSDGLWREEGLTVTRMAAHLDTPEHRIRAAINQGMGHRNFPSYVNTFRIDEARKLLIAPDMEDSTVLSIAYEVGFSSLGPFNRAFRASTGMTPTEFRKQYGKGTTPAPA